MAKATAVAVAVVVFLAGTARASSPLWPCEVTVSIEPGPFHDAAVVAVGQLDAATVISWPIVEDGMVVIRAAANPLGTHAVVAASESEKVWAEVVVDLPTTPPRMFMTGLLHELGHVAGLDHNDDERSVMNATVQWRRFQSVDLERLGRIGCSAA